jgi:hypothetical protein
MIDEKKEIAVPVAWIAYVTGLSTHSVRLILSGRRPDKKGVMRAENRIIEALRSAKIEHAEEMVTIKRKQSGVLHLTQL